MKRGKNFFSKAKAPQVSPTPQSEKRDILDVEKVLKYSNLKTLPFPPVNKDVRVKNLRISTKLGEGTYGVVYKGETIDENGNRIIVAKKEIKPHPDISQHDQLEDLQREIIMLLLVSSRSRYIMYIWRKTQLHRNLD